MTRPIYEISKRISIAALVLGLALPFTASAETLKLDLGSGAPAASSGAPVLGSPVGRWGFAGLIGLDVPTDSDLNVGFRLAAEGMYGMMDLTPQLRLHLGGRVSFAYHGADVGIGDASVWFLDFVPDAKLRYALTNQLGVYGDFGLGLALVRGSFELGGQSDSDTDISLAVQFGAGVAYAITPRLNLLGEIRFHVYTAGDSGSTIGLPMIGLEYHH